MKFFFHPDAEAEFQHAIDYYEDCEQGLGYDFSVEVYAAIQNILDFPDAWPPLGGDLRRCLTNRFPYGIVYCVEPDSVLILAVMHLQREPNYWKHRR